MIQNSATSSKKEIRFRGKLIGIGIQTGRTGKMMDLMKCSTQAEASCTLSITEQIEDIKEQMCSEYCKYPEQWNEKIMGYELCESEVCAKCPLNRL